MTSTGLLPSRTERDTRRFTRVTQRAIAPSTSISPRPIEPSVVIHCAGQNFLARQSMAEIFLRHAKNILASGSSELTPLLHADGVDLLLVTPSTAVACLFDGRTLISVSPHGVLDTVVPQGPDFSYQSVDASPRAVRRPGCAVAAPACSAGSTRNSSPSFRQVPASRRFGDLSDLQRSD